MRVTVPAGPLVTQAPSGLTATSTASAPIGIRRPLPGTQRIEARDGVVAGVGGPHRALADREPQRRGAGRA